MIRVQSSFLVRWWIRDDGGERIELIHLPSGAKAVTSSLAEAVRWMRLSATAAGSLPELPEPEDSAQTLPDEPGDAAGR